MNSTSVASDRLSISYLMVLTAGIGVSFFVARSIKLLRFAADAQYYNLESVSDVDAFGMLVAAVYGLSVTTLVIAIFLNKTPFPW
ncbi:hypothetical protein NHH03_25835, partial [Stieleria sp. TO1_6]|nr:hypothetical protein [Stieleria tagensis]